jgi:hypothetical protein
MFKNAIILGIASGILSFDTGQMMLFFNLTLFDLNKMQIYANIYLHK